MKRHGSMNRVYRLIWSCAQSAWIPVGELARGRGKSSLRKLSVAALSLASAAVLAGPEGGQVVAGAGTVSQAGSTTTINQSSQNLSLTWQSFNVAQQETVNFVQPGVSAIAVNRILDTNGSQILGHLNANGQVYLINPNGILFGQGAQVNVGGLVASTLDLKDASTLDLNDASLKGDTRSFSGSGAGSVINRGTINAGDGGYVALLGNQVSNTGAISAPNGTVALGAGSAATLTFSNNSLVSMQIDESVLNSQADNGGLIRADGGVVVMTAGAKDSLLASVVNNTGVIEAHTVENRDGTLVLLGGMQAGTVNVAGTLDASAPNGGNGGFIETSAAHVHIANDTKITTAAALGLAGTWLIDPVDFTIAASGGDMTGATLSSNLGGGDVVIQSSSGSSGTLGDVNVNDAVSWSANKLTLNAQNNININANLNASSSASLALEYGQGALAANNISNIVTTDASVNLPASTTNFTTKQGSNGSVKNYTVITSLGAAGSTTASDLQGISGNLAGNYVLGSDIDAAATSIWNAGAGFAPIGTDPARYTGTFDGLGHTVSGLYINRTGNNFIGLFGYTAAGSMVRNVGLIGGSVASDSWATGALVGSLAGTLKNSYAAVSVSGFQTVGGLVGVIDGGSIIDSHASGNVMGYGNGEAGGLVGLSWGPGGGTVSHSYATGNVSSPVGNVGGLMGINWGHISDSYATGTANGTDYIGGLVGNNSNGSTSNSYATGAVNGSSNVGGLAGGNSNSITNSYATGTVNGSVSVGGAVGSNYGTLSNSYATGNVTGGFVTGGLIGTNRGSVSYSHATGAVMGGDQTAGLVGGHQNGSISYSYATGDVTASTGAAGGLVGYSARPISNSYASGAVTGVTQVGGLLGAMNGSSITNSYATGAVTGTGNVGGLVGNSTNGTITNTYSTGAVSGTTNVGGLLGSRTNATVNNGYWDIATSGQAASAGGTGRTSLQMQTASNSTGFNFTTTPGATGNNWVMVDVDGTLNNAGGAAGATRPMLASEYSTTIGNAHQLQLMRMNLAASYTLGQNIDAAATGTAHDVWFGSTFIPVGSQSAAFTGAFDGLGHAIANLNINRPGIDFVGLFGSASGAQIRNVSLVNAQVIGRDSVGAFMGATVVGAASALSATGSVSGRNSVGGLIGYNNTMPISASYATTTVSGGNNVGGLMGETNGGTPSVFNYASGNVTATGNNVGGLVGYNGFAFLIVDSYATGNVTGAGTVGGLVGYHLNGGIDRSYSTGLVVGTSAVGGLIGYTSSGSVTNSYWNRDTSGQAGSAGGSARTTAQMQLQSTFTGWDFSSTWMGYDGHTNPLLRRFMSDLSVTLGSAAKTYDALAYSGGNGFTYSTAPNGNLLGTMTFGGTSQGATDAGTYTITGSGLYSNQQGYIVNYVSGALAVGKANLTVSGTRSYDGSSSLAGAVLTATGVAGQTFSLTGAGDNSNLANRNVQTGSALATLTGLTLGSSANGGLSSNYNALSTTGSSINITRAGLILGTNDVTKTYDGSLTALGTTTVTGGTLFSGDTLSGGTFAFTNANAGAGNKTVTTSGVTVNDGNGGDNYNVIYTNNTTSTITPANLAVTGVTANNKIYDGTTAATLTGLPTVAPIGADDVAVGGAGSGAFIDPNVGVGKAVSVSGFALTGSDAGNYTLSQPAGLTADITAVTAVTAAPDSAPTAEIKNVTGQIQSSIFFPAPNIQSSQNLSPELVDTQTSKSDSSTQNAVQNIGISGGNSKSLLQIVDGGMKLPPNQISENRVEEKNDQ